MGTICQLATCRTSSLVVLASVLRFFALLLGVLALLLHVLALFFDLFVLFFDLLVLLVTRLRCDDLITRQSTTTAAMRYRFT